MERITVWLSEIVFWIVALTLFSLYYIVNAGVMLITWCTWNEAVVKTRSFIKKHFLHD